MINSLASKLPLPKSWLVLGSLATSVTFMFILCWFCEPRWETNDDVGMSMFAHGYGLAAIGSPNLFFSNVLWGYIVRVIPAVNGVLGYSIATLGVLILVSTVLIYGLFRLGVGYVGGLSVLILILVRPVVFPQFTINAGLLLVGAVICWHLNARQNDWRTLCLGCLLAYCSFLVRGLEFILVLIVALPLLPWRILLLRRIVKIAFFALISAIVASAVLDYQAYQGNEWQAFNDLNTVRAFFTDFGAGELLKQHPEILARHGYSANDVDLIGGWFFVDPNIANPRILKEMLDELGVLPAQGNSFINGWIGVKALFHPNLIFLVMPALLLAVVRPSWQVAASWGLCLAALFILGFLGRPGVLRVYMPLVSLLLVAPFLKTKASGWRHRLEVGVLFVSAIANTSNVYFESKSSQFVIEQVRQALTTFPSDPVVVWAGMFPFQFAYPVLAISPSAMSYKLYGLGVDTLAPNDVSFAEQQVGRGMKELLFKETGVLIIAPPPHFKYLEIYCREHFHGQLKELSSKQYGSIVVSQRRCEVEHELRMDQ